MSDYDASYPQFINIDGKVKENYLRPLTEDERSIFYKKQLTDVFFAAAAIGLKNNLRKKSENSTDLRTYYGASDNYKMLIRIIALVSTDYNYDVLLNGQETLEIVEEYANGGAPMLYDKVMNSPIDHPFEEEVWDELTERKE